MRINNVIKTAIRKESQEFNHKNVCKKLIAKIKGENTPLIIQDYQAKLNSYKDKAKGKGASNKSGKLTRNRIIKDNIEKKHLDKIFSSLDIEKRKKNELKNKEEKLYYIEMRQKRKK